jgi:hypothetical protein
MRTITRRLDRIENQLCPSAPRPRTRFRVVVRREDPDKPPVRLWDREPSFERATCKRTLCPDGTLWEVVHLDKIGEDGEQPTEAELNRWIAGFPIKPLRTWHSEMTAP